MESSPQSNGVQCPSSVNQGYQYDANDELRNNRPKKPHPDSYTRKESSSLGSDGIVKTYDLLCEFI